MNNDHHPLGGQLSKHHGKLSLKQRWLNLGRNARAMVLAVVVHLAVLAVIGMQFDWSSPSKPASSTPVIQATALDEADIAKAAEALKQKELERKEQEAEQKRQAEQELAELEQQKREQAEALQQLEEERALEEQKKAEAEAARELAEQKRLEAEKQQAEREKRETKEKARKEEEAKKLAAKKAAEEKKQREKAAAEQAAREAALKEQLAEEQLNRTRAGELSAAEYAIQQAVNRNFSRQIDWEGLVVTYRITMSVNGTVMDLRLVKTSGNRFMDEEAHRAILKSSPLPVRLSGHKPLTYNLVFSPQF